MKKVIGILLIIILILQVNLSLAATSKSELEEEEKELEKQISEFKRQQEQIESEKSETLKEVESLITQISAYESDIEDLQEQIDDLQDKIDEAEKNIKIKEEAYNKEQELLDKRLITMYERGETTYLDVLLSSDDIIDFISTYYLLAEMVEADTQQLEEINAQKQEIENEKSKLESDKKQLDTAKATKESTYTKLKNAQSQKSTYVSKLTEDEKQIQKELDESEKHKKQIQEEIKKLAAQSNQTVGNIAGKPSSSGYIFPVAGLSKSNIYNKTYPSYPGHTGVDININVTGKKVVAVKSGTVVISRAISGSIKNYDSNGNYIASYSSYGEYVVIDHHDGTMTLYGHMKSGSRLVSVGQEVKQGQVIGTVGNTGNCKPRPTPSSPLNGTHLHFEVLINGKAVNPIPYLP